MKKSHLILLIILTLFFQIFPLTTNGQYIDFDSEFKINDNRSYFWGLQYSESGGYIVVNQGYIGTHLIKSDLEPVIHVMTYSAAMGGGNGSITSDDKYFIGIKRNFGDEEDTARAYNIVTGDSSILTWPQFADYRCMNSTNRIVVWNKGAFSLYDITNSQQETLPLKVAGSNWHRFIDSDGQMLVSSDEGLVAYDTKSWKEIEVIEPSVENHTDPVAIGKTHYCYNINNLARVRDLEHNLVIEFTAKGKNIHSLEFSRDLSYGIYINEVHDMYYYDVASGKHTLLVKSGNHMTYSGLLISPDGKYILTGVNGNRLLRFRIVKEGKAGKDQKMPVIFEYTEEVASEMAKIKPGSVIQIELALKNLGFDIPLDNIVTDADRSIHEKFCKKYGVKSIWSKEAQAILGISDSD